MEKDLTIGKPSKVLLLFCLPLFGSIIFQQLYNIADSLVAGNFIGEDALAAVGNGYEITLIYLAFAFGCNIGCSVIISKYYGEKNISKLKTTVFTTFIFSLILVVLLTVLGIIFCTPLLRLIKTPENIITDSATYLKIYTYGLLFVFMYNIATGIFSALGDSKTPFIFLAVSSISNIFMDILFVTVFKMGVEGVAYATLICQSISAILALIVVLKRLVKIEKEDRTKTIYFSFKVLKEILVIAIPSTLQQSFISIGNILIQTVINGFGSSAIAGYSAAIKLNNLMITSLTTIGNGISNYTAQNLGAGKLKRIHPGYTSGIKIVLTICIPFVLLYILIGKELLYLFGKSMSNEAINVGMKFLRIVSPFYFIIATKITADGILRGSSKMICFMFSTFTDLILRVILAFILSKPFGIVGVWCAWPIGWVISASFSFCFYNFMIKNKNERLTLEETEQSIE